MKNKKLLIKIVIGLVLGVLIYLLVTKFLPNQNNSSGVYKPNPSSYYNY